MQNDIQSQTYGAKSVQIEIKSIHHETSIKREILHI